MAKTIQYRCSKCLRLLFKWERGAENIQQRGELRFIDRDNGKKDVICSKCGARLYIYKDGLREVELVEVNR